MSKFEQKWRSDPWLTEAGASITAANVSTNQELPDHIRSTASYRIMQLIGQFTAGKQWSHGCDKICHEASIKLPSEEADILQELYERVTATRNGDENVHNVMTFWKQLDEYRDSWLQGNEEYYVTPEEANSYLVQFKNSVLW